MNLKKLIELIRHYLDEAQLSDDEDQIIVLCSILDDAEGSEKELRELLKDRNEKTGFYIPRPDGWKKAIKEVLGE